MTYVLAVLPFAITLAAGTFVYFLPLVRRRSRDSFEQLADHIDRRPR